MPRGESVQIGRIVVTCEHGGNRVPARYRALFEGRGRTLETHRGWDPGALELARLLARRMGAPLVSATVSRLVVDLNRSLSNPSVWSTMTAGLPEAERARIVTDHYEPYRRKVEREVRRGMRGGGAVLHLSVHSFTPVLRGVRREMDIGLLFDPAQREEALFCGRWLRALRRPAREGEGRPLVARANQPYRGTDDGLTTFLRGVFPAGSYLGIELEVNQRFARRGGAGWDRLQGRIAASLADVLADGGGGAE